LVDVDRLHRRNPVLPSAVLLLSAAWFLVGIRWGLPSRASDKFLFGERTPWTGAEIVSLTDAGGDGGNRAADVDVNPLDRSQTVVVNITDAQRAEIVRRYRLYSYQPDEMQTFMAIKEMKPGALDLDPKFYKYGGLWVYPVGAIIKIGSICGLVDVRADIAFYLDHPDAFARFYIAARLYTVAWALVGVWAIYYLARRATGDGFVAAVAALTFAAMPVVVNSAHEAKPHLPGVVLTLLAVMSAGRYVRVGGGRPATLMGLACGAAISMVPSALPVVLVVPVAAMLRAEGWGVRVRSVAAAAAVTVGVYVLTNPYVPINAVRRPELLKSHFSNSADFYRFGGWDALPNAATLLGAGMSPVLAVLGLAAASAVAFRLRRKDGVAGESRSLAILLGVPAVVGLLQFIVFAGGQPGDYGRFALLPAVALGLAAVCVAGQGARQSQLRLFLIGAILLTTLAAGAVYVAGFARDARERTTRLEVAEELEAIGGRGFAGLAAPTEPAPFSLPPVDLWKWRIELPPRGSPVAAPPDGVSVRPLDVTGDTWVHQWLSPRLSWASKSFAIDFEAPKSRAGQK
jgi:hypothetical protein